MIFSRIVMVGALCTGLAGCYTPEVFTPKSDYPADPWVKGYSNPNDCLGGEKLAAIDFDLPDYPKSMFRKGHQGWVIVRLDVDANGETSNVDSERAVPRRGGFEGAAIKAVRKWRFEPPIDGALRNCRVLMRFRLGGVSLGR